MVNNETTDEVIPQTPNLISEVEMSVEELDEVSGGLKSQPLVDVCKTPTPAPPVPIPYPNVSIGPTKAQTSHTGLGPDVKVDGMVMDKLNAEGKTVEHWQISDTLDLLTQIGAFQAPTPMPTEVPA